MSDIQKQIDELTALKTEMRIIRVEMLAENAVLTLHAFREAVSSALPGFEAEYTKALENSAHTRLSLEQVESLLSAPQQIQEMLENLQSRLSGGSSA